MNLRQVRETLAWYAREVGGCNRVSTEGDISRDRLAKDRGRRAEEALDTLLEPDDLGEPPSLLALGKGDVKVGAALVRPSPGYRAMVRVLYHYWIEDGKPCGEVLEREYFILGPLGDGDWYVGEELDVLFADHYYMHQLVTDEKGGAAKEEGVMEIGGVLTLHFRPATPNPSAWSGWNEADTEADIEPMWREALPMSVLDQYGDNLSQATEQTT